MPTFFVENFGCRATQADGASIERQFADRGLMPAECSSAADIVVLNSCTVTASADQDARSAIRRVRRENPGARIIVTGCYAQRAPEEVAALRAELQTLDLRLGDDECAIAKLDERTLSAAVRSARIRSGARTEPCRLNTDTPVRLPERH